SHGSLYLSNIHTGSLSSRFQIGKRADLFLGYTRVQDVGDNRRALAIPSPSATGAPLFLVNAQVFPLAFDSPQARLSIPLHTRLRLNFGYQFYRYREDFSALQNYRAHTGFASMLWSF
ncbi:MAG TPA: hypothetical protein DEH78_01180, partial [Solibacterales bacterium]|nr:hypothetical protein [Bryobacterales bacterium]